MIQRVVIFGGHIQALGLARQIASLHKEVVLVVEEACSVARFSRSVKRAIVTSVSNWASILNELELPD